MTMLNKIKQAVLDAIEKAAVKNVMDDEERKSYDMRHPYWREELEEYMEKRGIKKQPVEVASTGTKRRIDSEGRDVTDLPGLWSESDKIVNL